MLVVSLFGFTFGFLGSMPLAGPIAVLVFARGLAKAYRSGLAIAAGAAVAEAGYAFLAYWGVSELLLHFPMALLAAKGIAVAVLTGLGVAFALGRGAPGSQSGVQGRRVGSSFALGFGITAINPTFLATWSAAVAALHSTGLVPPGIAPAAPFAVSAGAGIVCWFAVMLALLRRTEGRLAPQAVGKVMRALGVALLGMAVWAAVDLGQAMAAR